MATPKKKRIVKDKGPDAFARRLTEGMAGWLSYIQACNRSRMYSEALAYLPVFEVALGRGLSVYPQRKIPKKEVLGRFPTVDFMFEHNGVGIFLEIKFAKWNAEHCLLVTKDIVKLMRLNTKSFSKKEPLKKVYRYILVLGRLANIRGRIEKFGKDIEELCEDSLDKYEAKRLLHQIEIAASNNDKYRKPDSAAGFVVTGIGQKHWRHSAVLLKEQKWWKSLSKHLSD